MSKDTASRTEKATHIHPTAKAHKNGATVMDTAENLLPEGSWQRLAAGVVAASGGGLLAAAVLGVGPAAIAGAAGYLAYRGMKNAHMKNGAAPTATH